MPHSAFVFAAVLLLAPATAVAQTQADVDALHAELEALRRDLQSVSGGVLVCPAGATQCPIRLFVSGSFVTNLFDRLLSNRFITFRKTGGNGWLINSGDGGAGCGYYVEVVGNDLNADLQIRGASPRWTGNGIELMPNFRFAAWGTIHGHVRGPACPFTGCGCTVGGGAGTTIGVRAERDDSLGLRVILSSDSEGWARVRLVQPQDKKIDVTVSIGLEHVGSLGIPTSFVIPASNPHYFEVPAPAAFAYDGEVTLPGGATRQYKFSFTGLPLELTTKGFGARLLPSIQWQ